MGVPVETSSSDPDSNLKGVETTPSSKKPRLFIKEMVMRNFKSYAGEQRVGPFHKMRLNKVSELIHNSSNHQNLDSASVSVHFQEIIDLNDGEYEAVPGSDFTITRVAFRDNSSKYYINDRASNFTEVTKKLKGKGIDLDNNRFLILQDVKNEAEAYMLKELSLLKWQEKATKLASEDAGSHVVELQSTVCGLEENIKEKREKIKENSKTLKDLETVHNKHIKKQEELDKDLKSCKDQFNDFERQDLKHREDLKFMKQKIKKLEDKLEKDSSQIEEISKECEESTAVVPKLEEEIPKLQKLLSDAETVLEEIKEGSKVETEKYRSELVEVRAELEPWEKQIIEHKGKLDVACSETKLLKEKHEAGQIAFVEAQQKMSDISNEVNVKTSSIEKMQADVTKLKSEAVEAPKTEQECIKEQESLILLEQAARQKVTELLSVLQSERSQGSVLKTILQAKESNQIQGIYGRMGDLGAIDAKYDVAISTACPGLDYIVVETYETAQACIELLRNMNVGTATFMILEKQRNLSNELNKRVDPPEGVPRLFDLVKVNDERMRLAFYAALRNTVVAKDLHQGKRIAYANANRDFRRVVTLDGTLFETTGTMSGGGNRPRGGKMGTSVRASSVSPEAVSNAEKELATLVDQLNGLRRQIADAVSSLKEQHVYIEKQLDSLKAASQPKQEDLDRLEELKSVISAEEKELDRLIKGSKKLKEKALDLQSKIENAGGERLKKQKSKVNQIQSDIDKHSTEINRCKVQMVTGEKTIKKLAKGIEESRKERERLGNEKQNMMGFFKEIEQQAFRVQDDYKKTQELVDQHKEVLDAAKEEYHKVKKLMDEMRTSEVDTDFKLQDTKKLLKEWDMKEKAYKKKHDDVQADLVKHLEQVQKDAVDPEKLQATLANETLTESCTLKRSLETVALLEAQLKEMNPNLDSISEYRKKASLYTERVEELNTVTQERDDLKKQCDELKKKRFDEFMAGFNSISLKLKEMYQMITLGGDAELELVDSLDPFSEGVVFSVRPPKKSWKNIALSGGEKTLSSLALVFALHHYKPTPLYVMDETDAALDFKNVSIVGHYVKDRTKDAQFIIISLRNNMFELADRLVGIYKTDNCTKSITINPGSFAICEKAG
ncbi:hypothetical protein MKX01_014998 [Papaver californicum]|nr:hypothetical protein MKX01_014998 [Papaver californicum]